MMLCSQSNPPTISIITSKRLPGDSIRRRHNSGTSCMHSTSNSYQSILNDYAMSIGLKINFHKSTLIPMNCERAKTQEIANIFGCVIAKLPFTYLGLPLGTTRPTVLELMPLVCSVERRLTATLNMISYDGKLSLLNSVIPLWSSLPYAHSDCQPRSLSCWTKFKENVCGPRKLNKGIDVILWPPGTWSVDPRNVVG